MKAILRCRSIAETPEPAARVCSEQGTGAESQTGLQGCVGLEAGRWDEKEGGKIASSASVHLHLRGGTAL